MRCGNLPTIPSTVGLPVFDFAIQPCDTGGPSIQPCHPGGSSIYERQPHPLIPSTESALGWICTIASNQQPLFYPWYRFTRNGANSREANGRHLHLRLGFARSTPVAELGGVKRPQVTYLDICHYGK